MQRGESAQEMALALSNTQAAIDKAEQELVDLEKEMKSFSAKIGLTDEEELQLTFMQGIYAEKQEGLSELRMQYIQIAEIIGDIRKLGLNEEEDPAPQVVARTITAQPKNNQIGPTLPTNASARAADEGAGALNNAAAENFKAKKALHEQHKFWHAFWSCCGVCDPICDPICDPLWNCCCPDDEERRPLNRS